METTVVSKQSWLALLRAGTCTTQFKADPIPPEVLESVLEAGCQTTLPWNLRPWQFIVVSTEPWRSKLLRHCPDPGPAATAPVLLVALGNPQAWKQAPARLNELMQSGSLAPGKEALHLERIQRQWSVGEAARVFAIAQTHAALQQIRLAALICDVASWWIYEFDASGLANCLNIPESLLVVGVLGLGYCADRTHLPAPSLARTVFAEAYGLPWVRVAGHNHSEGSYHARERDS